MSVLELQELTLRSAGHTRVESVSAGVHSGQVVAILGANGSGKSSLLALMAGQIAPTSGRALLQGRPVHEIAPGERARQLAWLGQSTAGAEAYSVRDVISWGGICRRGARGNRGTRGTRGTTTATGDATEMVERLGIAHLLGEPLGNLSGGERQRVHLARIWQQRTPITLLDEPDAALDSTGREQLHQLITDTASEGRSVVIVTHDRSWAHSVADEVWVMDAGTLTAQ